MQSLSGDYLMYLQIQKGLGNWQFYQGPRLHGDYGGYLLFPWQLHRIWWGSGLSLAALVSSLCTIRLSCWGFVVKARIVFSNIAWREVRSEGVMCHVWDRRSDDASYFLCYQKSVFWHLMRDWLANENLRKNYFGLIRLVTIRKNPLFVTVMLAVGESPHNIYWRTDPLWCRPRS